MYNAAQQLRCFREVEREFAKAPVPISVSGCTDSQKVHFAASLLSGRGWGLYVCRDDREAEAVLGDFRTFSDNVWLYPAKDLLFYSSDIRGGYIANTRMDAVKHLMQDESGVIVAPADALMDRIPARETVKADVMTIGEGMVFTSANLVRMLTDIGYEREAQVERMGQFAVRGGIFDIFPFTSEEPYRIEFFDEEVDTIRSFDPDTQRSGERSKRIDIYPSEGRSRGETVSFISYFKEDAPVFLDEPARIRERMDLVVREFTESMEKRLESGIVSDNDEDGNAVTDIFMPENVMEMLNTGRTVLLSGFLERVDGFPELKCFELNAQAAGSYKDSFELMIKDLLHYQEQRYRISILTPSHTRMSRLAESLRDCGIRAYCPDESSGELKSGETEVVYGNLRRGFIYPEIGYALLTEGDMFGVRAVRKKKKKFNADGTKISSLNELSVGDYVVHEGHGIGIYKGLEHISRDGAGRDYIRIEYAGGDSLYLPATKLDAVQKFASAEAKAPKLNKLNGVEWQKTKQRVAHNVKEIAGELVSLYAKRIRPDGFRYGEDTPWQKEFEELFPYEETDDQISAIEAVKSDMQSNKIMDRLVCGDVGFGKTEIALRAAFKAVQEGKQVAYLVPTTILAEQHFNTFKERMGGYPVRVEMLSRFRSSQQNKLTVEKLKNGTVDVVIGTHRLLSKDVGFKNIGLLIIDEEQRFGVAHKEKIKQLKSNIDVLTLTATPIPRTLHMSLSGIRDLSLLREPPVERIPVQTYVMEYNDELVREAAEREVQRGGQVFYVYNKVKGIEDKTDRLRALMPDMRIEYAHGQMNEGELEDIMHEFVSGEIDMLVSTTIIETGLDIPNANTLIIDGAERMGLSQLYQIRGRVGRSNKTAYAFFMYRKDKILSEEAEKRLKAIREFAELGAGIKIAMRDLELRGAGNVLGAEQHGQMAAVGYEMYVKLLSEAVRELQGGAWAGRSGAGAYAASGGVKAAGDGAGNGIVSSADGAGDGSGAVYAEEAELSAVMPYGSYVPGAGGILMDEQYSPAVFDSSVECDADAFIPESYIFSEKQRLDIYKRISAISNTEERDEMIDELIDRFGDLPKETERLLKVALAKAEASRLGVSELHISEGGFSMAMYQNARVNHDAISDASRVNEGQLRIISGTTPKFIYDDGKRLVHAGCDAMLDRATELMRKLQR